MNTAIAEPYRVMVVDDSAVIRGLLTRLLEGDPDVKVVASVADGQMAISSLQRGGIELAVLDIEMPVMDGLTALPKLLEIDPDLQVLMASTLTLQNAAVSMKALELGAADYIAKPSARSEIHSSNDFRRDLLQKVKALGEARRRGAGSARRRSMSLFSRGTTTAAAPQTGTGVARPMPAPSLPAAQPTPRPSTPVPPATPATLRPITPAPPPVSPFPLRSKEFTLRTPAKERPDVVAIGSSTGGPQALFEVLGDMKEVVARVPVLITQHMPATFTTILAEHIHRQTKLTASEAQDGELLKTGQIYVAPGNYHMVVKQEADRRVIRLNQDPPENFCRPSVDPMLRSLAQIYGRKILVVILTGMGADGMKGSEMVIQGGGTVIAQDEATSVVWGMPGAVAVAGLCAAVLPLKDIGPYVRRFVTGAAA